LAAASAGSLWVIWPCGLLQSALVVSGLANTPLAGACVMAAFALASSLGLLWLPQLWHWWAQRQGTSASRAWLERGVVRLAGGLLALGSVWALGQDVWGKVWAYCFG
jgi:sulfite exporter TauE/SafE